MFANDEMAKQMRYRYPNSFSPDSTAPPEDCVSSEISKLKQELQIAKENDEAKNREISRLKQSKTETEHSVDHTQSGTNDDQAALKKTVAQQLEEVGSFRLVNENLTDQIKQLEASIASLEVDKSNMKSTIAKLHQTNADLTNSQVAEEDNGVLQKEVNELREKVARLEEETRELEAARNVALQKVTALEEEKRRLEAAHDDALKKHVVAAEEENRQLEATYQKSHEENIAQLAKVTKELQDLKNQVAEDDVHRENQKLNQQLTETVAHVNTLQRTMMECEESLAHHIAVSDGKSKVIEKLEKQAGPTKEKLAAIEEAYSRLEGQMKSLSIDREAEKATAKKLAVSVENERATVAEEMQKLQKKIDALTKDLEMQKQAFWDTATAAGAARNESTASGNNEAEELKHKVVNLEAQLKESKKEQDVLRCRAKETQSEMLKLQKKAKALEKARKDSADVQAALRSAADEKSSPTAQDQMREAMANLGGAHYAIIFAVVCLGIKMMS